MRLEITFKGLSIVYRHNNLDVLIFWIDLLVGQLSRRALQSALELACHCHKKKILVKATLWLQSCTLYYIISIHFQSNLQLDFILFVPFMCELAKSSRKAHGKWIDTALFGVCDHCPRLSCPYPH